MRIGQLARLTNCSVQTIRYYEKQQLLSPPHRSDGNYRVYGQTSLEELTFIKHCRNLDITLSEIKQLIELRESPNKQCIEINDLIDNNIKRINHRMSELKNLKKSLVVLRAKCDKLNTVEHCGILNNLRSNNKAAI